MRGSNWISRLLLATVVGTFSAALLAEQLPAGLDGYWRITRQWPRKDGSLSTPCEAGPVRRDSSVIRTRVLLTEHEMSWGAATAHDPATRVRNLSPAEFAGRYLRGGVTLKDLGLNTSKITVIELGAPGSLPFDAIVVKDPSTVYFTRCGLFSEAVHDSGFVAPPLPDRP